MADGSFLFVQTVLPKHEFDLGQVAIHWLHGACCPQPVPTDGIVCCQGSHSHLQSS
ncbi:MAG: hypothetical protein JWN04_1141 [Myxococcaceae bacterium]|nr:hypothetical protein [Myxococcaceae bacterium]